MGSSWGSLIAQCVMTKTVQKAGVSDQQFLHAGGGFPTVGLPAVSVATDDVIAFERRSPSTIESGTVCPLFGNLERIWENVGIVGKASKAVNRKSGGTALGIDLVEGKFLLPKCSRLLDIVSGLIFVLLHRTLSPADSGHFFGVLQWMLLANRPLLACCGAIYNFNNAEDSIATHLPRAAARDLALIACLLPGLVVDLRSEWTPFITASDGAESFGYGGAVASCSPVTTRSLASLARSAPHAFYLADADLNPEHASEHELPHVHRVPLRYADFKTTFSVKASTKLHASKLEMGALCLSVKAFVRQSKWHRSRTFALLDSQVLLFACRKGRSGAENFRHGSRVLASLLIAAEVQLHTGFTPSRSNPSDPPSRGVHKIDKPCSTKVLHKSHSHTLTDHPHFLKRCHRNIIKRGVNMPSWSLGSWASSCSSSCLAQPSSIGY